MTSWYAGGGRDRLVICYSHQRPPDLLGAAAQILHVAQVIVGDLLPGLMLLPLHHVDKPSAINYEGAAGLVIQVSYRLQACF